MLSTQFYKWGLIYPTLKRREASKQFQEPYVLTGYRQSNKPISYYAFWCLFQRHNECMNGWTHLIATIVLSLRLWAYCSEPGVDIRVQPESWPLVVGFICPILLYISSTLAHLVHSRNELTHFTMFFIDYLGIGMYGFGSVLVQHAYSSPLALRNQMADTSKAFGFAASQKPVFSYNFFNTIPFEVWVGVFFSLVASSCGNVSKACYRRPYPFHRKLWLLLPTFFMYIWATLPIICMALDCRLSGVCRPSMSWHFLEVFFFFLGGFFYSSDMPQRVLKEGACDFLGHSHQIFHICIALCTLAQFEACRIDLETLGSIPGNVFRPDFYNTVGVTLFLLCLQIGQVTCFHLYIRLRALPYFMETKQVSNGYRPVSNGHLKES